MHLHLFEKAAVLSYQEPAKEAQVPWKVELTRSEVVGQSQLHLFSFIIFPRNPLRHLLQS